MYMYIIHCGLVWCACILYTAVYFDVHVRYTLRFSLMYCMYIIHCGLVWYKWMPIDFTIVHVHWNKYLNVLSVYMYMYIFKLDYK